MAGSRIVVVGGSAGGIDAVGAIVAGLGPDFPAPICVVIHVGQDSPGLIPAIIANAGPLPASLATDGARLQPGRIYIAPAGHHLLVEPGRLLLTRGPRENGFRPAVDPLFRSAAQVYGPGAIAVLVSGSLDDGTAGLQAIKRLGGVALVQDPRDAAYRSMPENAIRHVVIDRIARAAELGAVLDEVARTPPHELQPVSTSSLVDVEVHIAKGGNPLESGISRLGTSSMLTCPDCGGVLLRIEDGSFVRYRCHTGHAYSAESLVGALDDTIQAALWSAVRVLDEASFLLADIGAERAGSQAKLHELSSRGRAARRDAEIIRRLAMARQGLRESEDVPDPA
jgi:two-component system chemotaxis response regulator CheB